MKKYKYKHKKSKKNHVFLLFIVFMLFFSEDKIKTFFQEYEARSVNSNSVSTQTTTPTGEIRVSFLDVKQGDATLIQSETSTILIDTSSYQYNAELLEGLSNAGVKQIDLLIITHPDEDHFGGAKTILESYPVHKIAYPDKEVEKKSWDITLEAIEASEATIEHPLTGNIYKYDDIELNVISPEKITSNMSDNNSSIVIRLTHGKNSFLFMGDAEEDIEKELIQSQFLESDVLKCGHHGSSTATTPQFEKIVNPTYAIISCGANNPFGFPHTEVLITLEEDDVQVYRTDQLGTITAISNGNTIHFTNE